MKSFNASVKPFVLVMAGFIAGACVVNSSSSQNVQRAAEGMEVGRYQYVKGNKIFDTKTARMWRMDTNKWTYVKKDAPWEYNNLSEKERVERFDPDE